MALFLLALLI